MDWTSLAQSGVPSLTSKSSHTAGYSQAQTNGGGGGYHNLPQSGTATQAPHIPSLESAILNYEENMLQTILAKVTEENREKTSQMIVESNQKHWNRQRDQWFHELTGANQEEESQLLLTGGSNHDHHGTSLLLTHSSTNQQRRFFGLSGDPYNQVLDTELIKKHFAIIHETDFENAKSWDIIHKFLDLAKNLAMTEYATAWTIVSELSGTMSPTQRARLTAKSLGDRFREGMIHRLPQSFPLGEMKAEAIEFQKTLVPGDRTVWPAVYFCLRCGDAVAAKCVLEENGAVVPPVLSLLNTLASFQGTDGSTIWEKDSDFPFLDGHQVVAVKDLLDALKGNVHYNKYEAGVYGLLTGEKPFLADTIEGIKTTQDYSYMAIMNILLHSNDMNEGLAKLREEIIHSKHLSQESSWGLFLPLIAAQQYQQAFSVLLRIAPVQATHLALGFCKAKIPIQDFGKPDSSSDALNEILIKYASMLEVLEVSLKYLSLVSDAYRARSEMAKIVVAQPNLFTIAGEIDGQGSRSGGILSQVCSSREDVSHILVEAASLFQSKGNSQDWVLCLFLAERYGQMMKAMNSMLVPPERPGQDRAFWMNQARALLTKYVDIRPSPILQQLTARDHIALEETRILLALNDVFATKPSRLPQLLEDLLPHSDNELIVKQNRCQDFSSPVQAAYGPLLKLRVEMLQNEHITIKHGKNFTEAVQADLVRNKLFSDLIIRFAASIAVPPDHLHSIRQLGLMII